MVNNHIDKDSPISYYYQLKEIIIKNIENKEYNENNKLPTEKELCRKYNISRSTVRTALSSLENEDYIYKIQGKGSFVSPKKYQQDLLQFYSFTEEMKKNGKEPSSIVLNFKITNSTNKIAKELEVSDNDKIYQFTRLRLADDEPMMIETSFLPFNLFPNLTKIELEKDPLYSILMEKYDIKFTKAEEKFKATLLRKNEADYLDYIEGGPGILLERTTYNSSHGIIEYTKSVARGDKFEFRVILNKNK